MSEQSLPYVVGEDAPPDPAVSAAETVAVSEAAAGQATAEAPAAAAPAGVAVPLAGAGPAVAAGDWVEYCLKDGFRVGEWRPALVVRMNAIGDVNLQVFADGPNDYLPCPLWVESVLRGSGIGQWRPRGGG